MDSVVVDTDVVSFWFKGDSRSALYRSHLAGRLLIISWMTVAELDEWACQHRWGSDRCLRMDRHLQRFLLRPLDRQICRLWAEIRTATRRSGKPIGHADAWVAATALACGAPLVTHNASDFRSVSGLSVVTVEAS
jgi:tRNA(fMet)-specific endonuclease VapC